jgi:hypothetical protein
MFHLFGSGGPRDDTAIGVAKSFRESSCLGVTLRLFSEFDSPRIFYDNRLRRLAFGVTGVLESAEEALFLI